MNERLLRLMGHRTELYPHHLEAAFPALLENLTELWGTPEFDAFAGELMFSDRSGRQGFPPDVAMELFRLAQLHKAQMKLLRPQEAGAWDELPDDARRGTRDWGEE